MLAAPSRDWNVFKQIVAEHWDGFTHAHPRYQTPSYDNLVAKRLACGNPAQMGSVEYRCLQCGQGTHRGALRCTSSLCLRCAKVDVDNWVSQVSEVLHEGVISRHIILTVPAMFRTTFSHNAALLWSAFMRCGAQCLDEFSSAVRGAVQIIARLTYRQRYEQSTGRDPLRCPHGRGEMGLWRIWHPTYGVIYDEGEVIKRGTYASTAQRAGP